jgi:8-oxo-dGTP pyrophosphatase MutT (NUDIX family)
VTPGASYGPVRVAARALVVIDGRVLLVNAYRGFAKALWCAPGGGCTAGAPMTETLRREVWEETGLVIRPGALAGVSEFHDPAEGFHQVDLFFRASAEGRPDAGWRDPEGVVSRWHLASPDELTRMRHKPDHLAAMAFGDAPALYHGLELKV